jgi:hypothetical protein
MGALIGFLTFERMPCNSAIDIPRHYIYEAGTRMVKPIILRGVDDWITLYNWGIAPPGGSDFASVELELEEDNS